MFNLRDQFLCAYLEAMFWTESGEEESSLSSDLDWSDISEEFSEKIVADLAEFRSLANDQVSENPTQAGHDFWLTRNRHGSGFWDRPEIWGKDGARMLTTLAHDMGEVWVYLGDDGRIYG